MRTHIEGDYHGQSKALFQLYLKTAFLTLITLGIYRFWAKTRIRSYVWSAASAEGDSFEYTGTGLEKFLGFLMAVVILAIYLGIVQILLLFVGLSFSYEAETVVQQAQQIAIIYITLLAVLPLFLFAQYRARRYKMARTRWRGIRFGMENGAWGYAVRALWYYFLVLITFGILTPLATFRLEKYMADRSWYGSAQFVQEGRWQALYRGMRHIFIGIALTIIGPILGAVTGQAAFGLVVALGYLWLTIGIVAYRIHALNYLTNNKVLSGRIRFRSDAQAGSVVQIALIGGFVIGLVGLVVLGVAVGILSSLGQTALSGVAVFGLILAALLYVLAFLLMGGLNLVMIVQPTMAHVIGHISLQGAEHLALIQQRAADQGADAEGFADALDVGGAL